MAFIMGNQKVGEAKAYETNREYEQEKQIESLQKQVEIMKEALKCANRYMTESGYHTIEPSDPEYQMWKDVKQALERIRELEK